MNYEDQLKDYRSRRNILWIVFATCVSGALALALSLQWLFDSEVPVSAVVAAWMIAFVVAGARMSWWPCPRCGRSFFSTLWMQNPLATRCVHCGLPKWAGDPVYGDAA